MKNKVLMALDESDSTEKKIAFAVNHLNKDHDITLFHVVPDTAAACGLDSPSLTPYFEKERNAFCRMEERRQRLMEEMLGNAKSELISAGFTNSRINVKARVQSKGIAADIIQEATQGGYDMVVVGRRSSSGIKEFLTGSTVQRLIHGLTGMPLVIVDG